jgi:hypothetical protein
VNRRKKYLLFMIYDSPGSFEVYELPLASASGLKIKRQTALAEFMKNNFHPFCFS